MKFNISLTSRCPSCGEEAPDEIDMKEVEFTSLDPIVGQDFICPTCGNTFTHKGEDVCPFCDEELDFEEFRTEASKELEASSEDQGNLEIGKGYTCNRCDVVIVAEHEVENCPKCNNVLINGYNCKEYELDDTLRHMRADSGEFLHGEGDEFTKIALDAAAEEDSTLEQPLPDPEKKELPLSTRVQKTSNMSLKEMFKKVFGGGA